jgi:crotonobetainyl-CoA:carnitine CoA-transferase CaiB-like acyl-CoA transferase
MGADVITVSHPRRGDLGGSDRLNLNRNKRSALVDLSTDEGRQILFDLCSRSDVLVENFRPAVKARLGITPAAVWEHNPRLVYASISGFGQTGPYADRPGVDQIAQGLGGLMSVTGPPGGGPWRTGIAVSDTAAGTLLAQGILAALVARQRTGRGQWVHTSLLEAMVSFMDFQAARWLNDGEIPEQEGNEHPTITGMGTYAASDGLLNVAAIGSWSGFCTALGAPELATDPRFGTHTDRLRHRPELHDRLGEILSGSTVTDWVERLNAAGYPAGPVLRVDEAMDDPQVRHLEMVSEAGEGRVLRHPVTFTETPASVRSPAPSPGADTREVLAELGIGEERMAELVAGGVVATDRSAPAWNA